MTPEDIRSLKTDLFATHRDIDSVMEYGKRLFNGKDKQANAMILIGIAVNTTLEMVAQEYEAELALETTKMQSIS